jgi:sec-independent protein translocase protein TatA
MGLDNPLHIAVIVVLLLLVFGAKRLPEIGRSLGTGMREFKDSVTGGASADSDSTAASSPVRGGQPALTQAAPAVPAAPVAQPAPAEAPVQGDEGAAQQPASAPLEQSRQG